MVFEFLWVCIIRLPGLLAGFGVLCGLLARFPFWFGLLFGWWFWGGAWAGLGFLCVKLVALVGF